MNWQKLLLACLALSFVAACSPKEEDVCKHLREIYKNGNADVPNYMQSVDRCVGHMHSLQKRQGPNSYHRLAKCWLEQDRVFAIRECEEDEIDKRTGRQRGTGRGE